MPNQSSVRLAVPQKGEFLMSATLWVCRDVTDEDPLLAAYDALRQEIVIREARRLRLQVWTERDGDYLDYGIRGHHLVLLSLLKLLEEWGITGLTVDVATEEAWQTFAAAHPDFDFVNLTAEEEHDDHHAVLAGARSD